MKIVNVNGYILILGSMVGVSCLIIAAFMAHQIIGFFTMGILSLMLAKAASDESATGSK